MRDIFDDLLLGEGELAPKVTAALAGVKEAILAQKGIKSGTPTPIEYFAALTTVLSNQASATNKEPNLEALASPLFLLGLLLPKVPKSVVQFRFEMVATMITTILKVKTTDEGIVLSCVTCLKTICSFLDPAQLSQVVPKRAIQSLLVFSIDPREEIRTSTWRAVCETLIALDPLPKLVEELVVRFTLREIGECTSDDLLGPVYLMEMLSNVIYLLSPKAMSRILNKLFGYLCINPIPVLHQNSLGLLKCIFGKIKVAEPYKPLCLQFVVALKDRLKPGMDQDVSTVPLYCKALAAGLACLYRQGLLEDGDKNILSIFEYASSLFLTGSKTGILRAATSIFRTTLLKYLNADFLARSREIKRALPSDLSPIEKICDILENLLSFEYKGNWDQVFVIYRLFFQQIRQEGSEIAGKLVLHLGVLRTNPGEDLRLMIRPLDRAIGMAIEVFGAAFVFEKIPPRFPTKALVEEKGVGTVTEQTRRWLLPILKANVHCGDLIWFAQTLVKASNELVILIKESEQENKSLAYQFYENIFKMIWNCFPAFCRSYPRNAATEFPRIAPSLGKFLIHLPPARRHICRGMTCLIQKYQAILDMEVSEQKDEEVKPEDKLAHYQPISRSKAQAVLDAMKPFAGKFLPVIFNCLLESSAILRQNQIECIQEWCTLASKDVIVKLYSSAQKKFLETVKAESKHALLDVLIALAPALPQEQSTELFNKVVKPHIVDRDGIIQKKVYVLLHLLLTAKNTVIDAENETIILLLVEARKRLLQSGKRKRLECILDLVSIVPPESALQDMGQFFKEVVENTKGASAKLRRAAHEIIGAMGKKLHEHNAKLLTKLAFQILEGLKARKLIFQSATMISLASLIHQCRRFVEPSTVTTLLNTILQKIGEPSRHVLRAVLKFVKTCITVLPIEMLEEHLEKIVHAVFNERNDPMNKFKKKVRYMTIALLRRFGHAKMEELVPEEHHKLLSHIRKEIRRKRTRTQNSKSINSRLTSFSLKSGFTDATTRVGGSRTARTAQSKFYASTVWHDSDFSDDEMGYGSTMAGARILRAENRVRIKDDRDEVINLMDPGAASKMVIETSGGASNKPKGERCYLKNDEAEIDDEGKINFGWDDDEDKPRGRKNDNYTETEPAKQQAGKRRKVWTRKRKQKGGGGGDDQSSYALHLIKPGLLGRKQKAKKNTRFKEMMIAPNILKKLKGGSFKGKQMMGQQSRGMKRKR